MSHLELKPFHLLCLASLAAIGYALGQVAQVSVASITSSRGAANQAAVLKAVLSESVSVQSSGRGNPEISLSDGREVLTSCEGPEELARALQQNTAQPLSLASADFDEDGVPDLINGYAADGSGIVTLLRGNVDSLFPNSPEAQRRKSQSAFTESPFLSPARVFGLAQPPDFIGAGDFDADGHWDVVTAARGSNALYLLSGDGRGSFAFPVAINLPGTVTTLAVGEINRADSLDDVVVGVVAANGPKLMVFEGPEGALRADPETFRLPAEAASLAFGQLVDDYAMDLAVAAGNKLLIISGRDRKLSLDQAGKDGVPEAKITRQTFSSSLKSIASGDFTGDHKTDIAILFDDGKVQLLSEKNHTGKKNKGWKSEELSEGPWPHVKQLVRAHVSSFPHDDLVLIDPGDRRLHILAAGTEARRRTVGGGAYASLEADTEPIAVLPMRLNVDAGSSLVVLSGNRINPSVIFPQGGPPFIVTTAADNGTDFSPTPGSLREAIINANIIAGADVIVFAIGSGLQTIMPLMAPLPPITDQVTIDGTTQPGFAGSPIIELNGTATEGTHLGLDLRAGGCTIRGLVINRFDSGGISMTLNGSNQIEGCFIGTNAAGTAALGSQTTGVVISNVSNNTIGGTTAAARNVISGNTGEGVRIHNGAASANQVQGNFIGTNVSGAASIGNGTGVFIATTNNVIGGTSAGARNIISGNSSDGILMTNPSPGNQVVGNFIGTNVSGAAALSNAHSGVFLDNTPTHTIGGTSPASRNVISGNGLHGVRAAGAGSTGILVQGNFIGTDVGGSNAVGNMDIGVLFENADGNTIGGTSAGARNVISGNGGDGVKFETSPSNQVLGNFIGVDVGGTAALGNGLRGVFLVDSPSCTIGGTAAGAGNVISANTARGIDIFNAGTTATLVQGNFIGTDANGSLALGNGLDGVLVNKSLGNTIGGTAAAAGNVIANNGTNGVLLLESTSSILRNSIFSNSSLGIDLNGDGVTANDGGDGDAGPNNLQNFPVLTFVNSFGGSTTILGSLDSVANTNFRVEFFSNVVCDGSGNGEGQTFIGSANVLTDGGGNAAINAVLPVSLTAGHVVTATATDPGNNTSEFSACRIVQMLSTSTFVVDSTGNGSDINIEDNLCDDGTGHCTLRAAIEQANHNPGAQTINFNIPGAGVHTISVSVIAFSTINDPVVIDGYTQPGSSVNNMPNSDNAVLLIEIEGSMLGSGNGLTITGGNSTVRGLVINRFPGQGIAQSAAGGNQIKGCFIGTNAGGTGALGNSLNGVLLQGGQNNVVGGTAPAERNIISGNGSGVAITGSASLCRVSGNFIGTDASGTAALGNSGSGVVVGSQSNLIGEALPGGGNIISGNGGAGVRIQDSGASSNSVANNFIGTNAASTAAIPNAGGGVLISDAHDNAIGSGAGASRNVISGNSGAGVEVRGSGATLNRIQGNFIGTDAAGTGMLGNASSGVLFSQQASNNLVDGSEEATNIIGFNASDGVTIESGTGNFLLSNSIHDNSGLGIDLGSDDITTNDGGDGDSGANNLQNFPVLTAANSFGGNTTITGTLNSTAGATFRIEFFANSACDPSGNGEGQTFEGFVDVMADAGGNATINAVLPVALAAGLSITATATNNATRDTSEFSNCVMLTANAACSINCTANVSVSTSQGQCTALVNYPAPTIGGACGNVNCSPPSGSIFAKGTTLVSCTTTAGPSCSFNVTVNDTEAPRLTCPADIRVFAPPNQTSVNVNYSTPIASDNCPGSTVICTPPSPGNFPVGVTAVNCTATDSSGNTGLCSFAVIVGDASIISINDVNVVEGNAGTATAVFTVNLSPAAGSPVTVNFATADGSAKAGSDYLSNAGTLSFNPGQTSKSISVQVTGDSLNEPDETFFVNLSAATNAVIVDAQGAGKIVNDDGVPGLSIGDVSVIEGNSGFANANFVVTLSPVSGSSVTVSFATADGTATVANLDYIARSGVLTFAPGETSKSVVVQVAGDASQEPDETFQVTLSGAANAAILDGVGVGTIVNDEAPITADLSVTVSVAESVNSGEQLAYMVSVSNAGPRVAASITVFDRVEGETTFSSASSDKGAITAPNAGVTGPVTWTLSSLAPGEHATLELVVNVLAVAGTTLANTATAQSLSADPNQANNIRTAFTAVEGGGVVELAWEQPGSSPINPTPAPTNVRVEGAAGASGILSSRGVRAAVADVCTLAGFKVYLSPSTPVQITNANLWRSDLPADTRKVSLPALPAGTFYSVVAVWNCEGAIVDSPPSNEAASPPQPEVKKIKVTGKIKIIGKRFQKGLEVSVLLGGAQTETKFEAKATVKKSGTQVIQKGKLTNGMTIEQVVRAGNAKLVLRNPDGGKITIALPGLPPSP